MSARDLSLLHRDDLAPGERFFGAARVAFGADFNFAINNRIGYYRVWLDASRQIGTMRTFVQTVPTAGGGGKALRMGIYAQDDPLDATLPPTSRVAQTASRVLSAADNGTFVDVALSSPYTPGVSGWYWLALVNTHASVTLRGTGSYPSGFMPIREETTTGDTLPATAAGSVLESPALYLAAVED